MATDEDTDNRGRVWVLDQQLDQPMEEEAKKLRNPYNEKVSPLSLSGSTILPSAVNCFKAYYLFDFSISGAQSIFFFLMIS